VSHLAPDAAGLEPAASDHNFDDTWPDADSYSA
jgi:hypothetical protein